MRSRLSAVRRRDQIGWQPRISEYGLSLLAVVLSGVGLRRWWAAEAPAVIATSREG
jgi:hypothetical protein